MPITNALEERLARTELGLTDAERSACMRAPIGPVIVGEAPGNHTSAHLPMFPWPASSAGGRLMAISLMSPFDYLRTFHRVNLMRELLAKWSNHEAAKRATDLLLDPALAHRPLVLLGAKVAAAFAVRKDEVRFGFHVHRGRWMTALPHPSGLNLILNDPLNRLAVRRSLWQAVDLMRWPLGPHELSACDECGRLAIAHPPCPGSSGVYAMCPGHAVPFAERFRSHG